MVTEAGKLGSKTINYLRSTRAIRERCGQIFSLAQQGKLSWFSYRPELLDDVVTAVQAEVLSSYPTLDVPYHSRWRHFDVGGVDREARIDEALRALPDIERGRAKCELAIVSVLLDAGAGSDWRYTEPVSGFCCGRSEGLALASLDAFAAGTFGDRPYTVTADGLKSFTPERLRTAFQVSDRNPLVGVEGRCGLMHRLGTVIDRQPGLFVGSPGRLGGMLESIAALTQADGVPGGELLHFVLTTFADIWPGRLALDGHNLGDVWQHSQVVGEGATNHLVPFHKLSQWLTYSLIEPLHEAGISVVSLDELTGLAEYRNGGLFIDTGVLDLTDPALRSQRHAPASELIVEWRALTVALLDEVAVRLRVKLGLSDQELPLAKVLQGGTWSVGRKLAVQRDPAGSPPLVIESDGTVF